MRLLAAIKKKRREAITPIRKISVDLISKNRRKRCMKPIAPRRIKILLYFNSSAEAISYFRRRVAGFSLPMVAETPAIAALLRLEASKISTRTFLTVRKPGRVRF